MAPILLAMLSAADNDRRHPHQGIIPKFNDPIPATLTKDQKRILLSGKPIYQNSKYNNIDRGTSIFDVSASKKTVWEVITSFENYPKWIQEMSATKIYSKKDGHIFVNFTISAYMVDIQYYIKHDYKPDKGYMTFTLDYNRCSDLDDSVGYWLVYPSPSDTMKTRVEYSVVLRIGSYTPNFIETILADKGIKNATRWVKINAEKVGFSKTIE